MKNSFDLSQNTLPFPILENEFDFNQEHMKKTQKKKITRNKFTIQEDEELIRLVSIYSDKDWTKISEEMCKTFSEMNSQIKFTKYNRTPRQCRDRYINYLSPDISNGEWTQEEDQLLMLKSTFSLCHWKEMKQLFPGRSEIAIRNRFNYLHRVIMCEIKPKIAYNLTSIQLFQKDGSITIEDSMNSKRNSHKTTAEQIKFLNHFNLNLNQSYVNSVKSDVLNICKENYIIPSQNEQLNNSVNNNAKKKNKSVMIPQQWIDAAKTIIKATQTDEIKNSISELRTKVETLYGIVENRSLFENQNNFSNIFNIPSESETYDDMLMFNMFE